MQEVKKAPARIAAVVAKPKPARVPAIKAKTPVASASKAVIKKPVVKAAVKPVVKAANATVASKALVPNAPETKKTGATKRKRLSKAFSRPLYKKIKESKLVRMRFNLLDVEYAKLAGLKQRLSDQGVSVKKSELMRAGLMLIVALDDAALKRMLSKVPALD